MKLSSGAAALFGAISIVNIMVGLCDAPADFAYRMQVEGTGSAAAYRLSVPLPVYQKITRPDLADVRLFNAKGEVVPYALERPSGGTVTGETKTLPVFALRGDTNAALDALRVTIESGSQAINVHAAAPTPTDRITSYLADARPADSSLSALELQWPDDAPDFAGRIRVEASDDLSTWRMVAPAAPIANLHSGQERLIERRVDLPTTRAQYFRLSWVGPAAPFALTAVQAEPSKRSVDATRSSLTVPGSPAKQPVPGELEFDLGATVPVDRVNVQLPETNTVVEVELLSRARNSGPWRSVLRTGLYRLKSDTDELRNGPIPVDTNTDRYWLLRADLKGGGIGSGTPQLTAEWIPHEIVFVARGTPPFYLAYGSAAAESAAVSLAAIPGNFNVTPATLGKQESLGGEARLAAVSPDAHLGKKTLLWAILVFAAALLAWMALRLYKEFS